MIRSSLMGTDINVPTRIMTTVMPNAEKHSQTMREVHQWFVDNDLMVDSNSVSTSIRQSHTPYLSQFYTNALDDFYRDVETYILEYFKEIDQPAMPMTLGESWIIKYEKGASASPHTHWPHTFGITYYFDVEDRTPLLFTNHGSNRPVAVTPADGLLCIFPAQCEHSVPVCNGSRGCWASNWGLDISELHRQIPPEERHWEKLSKSRNR